jgi:polar amino acid transport system substrate-binding protein/glutamate/aspartate transport system substrate-binding protein
MRVFLSVVFAALLASSSAAAGTLDRMREGGSFRIGYRTDAAPFSSANGSGEPSGYVVDICREVVAAAKLELDRPNLKIEYVAVTAEDRFDAVKSGRVDLLCEATTVTLARRELVDFSLMTFIDGASVMVRSDGPQSFKALAGHKIGVRAGTTTEAALGRTLTDLGVKAEMVPVADHKDGVKRLAGGELAAYFADRMILTALFLEAGSPAGLRISKEHFSREPYALALARGDDEFRLLVDRALARLYRSGAIEGIFARSFGKAKASDVLKALYVINALPE